MDVVLNVKPVNSSFRVMRGDPDSAPCLLCFLFFGDSPYPKHLADNQIVLTVNFEVLEESIFSFRKEENRASRSLFCDGSIDQRRLHFEILFEILCFSLSMVFVAMTCAVDKAI